MKILRIFQYMYFLNIFYQCLSELSKLIERRVSGWLADINKNKEKQCAVASPVVLVLGRVISGELEYNIHTWPNIAEVVSP